MAKRCCKPLISYISTLMHLAYEIHSINDPKSLDTGNSNAVEFVSVALREVLERIIRLLYSAIYAELSIFFNLQMFHFFTNMLSSGLHGTYHS